MGNTGSRQSAPTTTQIRLFDGKVVTARIGTQIVEEPKPTMDATDGISISGAEGCNNCTLTLPMGVSAASVQLFREYGDVSEEECKRLTNDLTAVRLSEKALIEVKNNLLDGKYFFDNGNGFCSQIVPNKEAVDAAKNVSELTGAIEKADIIKIRKKSEGGGYSSPTKLFITPSIPFKFSFVGGTRQVTSQFEIKRITLYRPCPIRIENIQYDAVLSLNDPSDKTSNAKTIILVPIQVKPTPDQDSDRFIGKISSYIPGILLPNPATNQFETINVPTGNDWDVSKLLKPNPDGSIKNGFFVWTGTPELEKYSSITYSGGVATDIRYKWRSASNTNAPIYILMKNPITVSPTTMQKIQMLPVTPSKEAIQFPFPGTLTYKPGPPGSDVVGCQTPPPTSSVSSLFGTTEGFEGAAKCDPFNNFPNSVNAEDKRIETQQMFWEAVGWVGASLAVIFTVWLAIKFVQSPYGKALFGKLGEKLADIFAKKKNAPSMFDTGGSSSGPDEPTLLFNPMRQPGAKPQTTEAKTQRVPKATRSIANKTLRGVLGFKKQDVGKTEAEIQKRKERKKKRGREETEEEKRDKRRSELEKSIEKAPKLPTNAELNNNAALIKQRDKVKELHRLMGLAKLSANAAKSSKQPTANEGQKENNYKNTKAEYIRAAGDFGLMMKEVEEEAAAKKKKDDEEAKAAAKAAAAEKKKDEEEAAAAKAAAEEAEKTLSEKSKLVVAKANQLQTVKAENASPAEISSAQAELKDAANEVKEEKKGFDTTAIARLFSAQPKSPAITEAKKAISIANEALAQPSALRSTEVPQKFAKTIKRRQIKIEQPDEEIKDTQEAANVVDARLKSSDLAGANKAATQLVSNSKKLREEYEKNQENIQEQHRMEGTTTTARELADARKMVSEAENIEKKTEEVKENIKSAMTEEDKEKAARNYAAAQAGVKFTEQRLIQLGKLPTLVITGQQPRKQGGRRRNRRKHTKRH